LALNQYLYPPTAFLAPIESSGDDSGVVKYQQISGIQKISDLCKPVMSYRAGFPIQA
jgi:hypothetical protein